MTGLTTFFQTITLQMDSFVSAMQGFSGSLLSLVSRMGTLSVASYDFLKFILQFVPPPLLVLFGVELVFGIVQFFLSTVSKFKLVIKWW